MEDNIIDGPATRADRLIVAILVAVTVPPWIAFLISAATRIAQ